MSKFSQMLHNADAEHTLLGIMLNPLTKKEQYDTIEGYIKQVERYIPFFIEDDSKTVWKIAKTVRANSNEHPSIYSLVEYQAAHPETSPNFLNENPDAKGIFNIATFTGSLDIYFAQNYIRILAECARRRFIKKLGNDLVEDADNPEATFYQLDTIKNFKAALESNYYVATDKIAELAKSCLMDFSKPAEKAQYWLTYNGRGFCVKGGISAFSGKAKKGKTQFLMLLTSALVSGQTVCGITANEKPKKISWIDTEQKDYSIQGNFQRVMRTIGREGNPSDYGIEVYSMRYNTVQECKDVAQWLATQNSDIIVIDGLLDLCFNMNDMAESKLLINFLIQLTKTNVTVFVVLHENEGQDSDKMSGALGSELERKYDDKFSISKKDDTFTAAHSSRNSMSIPKIEFHIEASGYEPGASSFENEDEESPEDIAYKAACDALENGPLRYNNLVSKMQARLGTSKTTTQRRIKSLLETGKLAYSDSTKTITIA